MKAPLLTNLALLAMIDAAQAAPVSGILAVVTADIGRDSGRARARGSLVPFGGAGRKRTEPGEAA